MLDTHVTCYVCVWEWSFLFINMMYIWNVSACTKRGNLIKSSLLIGNYDIKINFKSVRFPISLKNDWKCVFCYPYWYLTNETLHNCNYCAGKKISFHIIKQESISKWSILYNSYTPRSRNLANRKVQVAFAVMSPLSSLASAL